MRLQLQSAIRRKLKVIFLDEIMFTKSTNLTHEWSTRHTNIKIPEEARGLSYTAVIAAISEGCGFELIELHEKGVNQEMFSSFLYKLAALNKRKKVSIVMDNLSAHRTRNVKALLRQLKMEYIYNVPYSPEFNPIELCFS